MRSRTRFNSSKNLNFPSISFYNDVLSQTKTDSVQKVCAVEFDKVLIVPQSSYRIGACTQKCNKKIEGQI